MTISTQTLIVLSCTARMVAEIYVPVSIRAGINNKDLMHDITRELIKLLGEMEAPIILTLPDMQLEPMAVLEIRDDLVPNCTIFAEDSKPLYVDKRTNCHVIEEDEFISPKGQGCRKELNSNIIQVILGASSKLSIIQRTSIMANMIFEKIGCLISPENKDYTTSPSMLKFRHDSAVFRRVGQPDVGPMECLFQQLRLEKYQRCILESWNGEVESAHGEDHGEDHGEELLGKWEGQVAMVLVLTVPSVLFVLALLQWVLSVCTRKKQSRSKYSIKLESNLPPPPPESDNGSSYQSYAAV